MSFERLLSLRKAQGKAALEKFLTALIKHVSAGELDAAISACDGQRGSLANIIKSGLERFREISSDKGMEGKDKMTEVQRVIEEVHDAGNADFGKKPHRSFNDCIDCNDGRIAGNSYRYDPGIRRFGACRFCRCRAAFAGYFRGFDQYGRRNLDRHCIDCQL